MKILRIYFFSFFLFFSLAATAQIINTPGVYIKDVPIGLVSLQEVASAIPAFIGYTEKAALSTTNDLLLSPKKISSFADFERLYGRKDKTDAFVLYPSIHLYFANGGTSCYVISIGNYKSLQTKNFIQGLEVAAKVDEVTLLAFPDAANLPETGLYDVQKEALKQAATLKDRFCILDLKAANTSAEHATAVNEFRKNIGSNNLKFGAAYTPFVITSNGLTIPPSAIIAAQYCATDKARGVWKAAANVRMLGITDVAYAITESEQAGLNVDASTGKSINAIRKFSGKGVMIWGSRTLAGNDNEWRYVPVRRFFMMVEESVTESIQPFVFEPNDANTWVKVKTMIDNYLITKWRAGALAGAKPEQAFFVKVGLGETMSSQDLLDKKLIIEIGMAPLKPAEFIISRIVLKIN